MKQSNTRNSDYTYSPSTSCVHEGTLRDPISGGVNTPIFPSSAIDYRTKDIRYPRNFNTPNNDAVAKKLATLELSNGEMKKSLEFSLNLDLEQLTHLW